ncbi:MAG: hypothetical protein AAGI54_08145 [Planctomycetota bacterium]
MPRLAPLALLLLATPSWAAPSFDRWAHEQHAARLARVAAVEAGAWVGKRSYPMRGWLGEWRGWWR